MDLAAAVILEADEPETQRYLKKTFTRIIKDGIYKISIYNLSSFQCSYYDYSHQWKSLKKSPVQDFKIRIDKNSKTFPSVHMMQSKNMVLFRHVKPDRLLAFELDVSGFLARFLRETRSGKTGYSWLIDGNGLFMFHPFTGFIGKSAFMARDKRDPDISHKNINFIQENNMLKGLEGTGVYTSGWHRGITGQIEKLIAYAPVNISKDTGINWSVAVVAPSAEIDEYINRTYLWRFLSHAVIILIIVLSAGTIFFNERRVEQKTGEHHRSAYRHA